MAIDSNYRVIAEAISFFIMPPFLYIGNYPYNDVTLEMCTATFRINPSRNSVISIFSRTKEKHEEFSLVSAFIEFWLIIRTGEGYIYRIDLKEN